jgi:Inner membrane component of T3SS, cytoplasmic domain
LKVLSGPHAGAELLLGDGELLIGAADYCDIVMLHRMMAAEHATLSLAGDSVECLAKDGATLIVKGGVTGHATLEPCQRFSIVFNAIL